MGPEPTATEGSWAEEVPSTPWSLLGLSTTDSGNLSAATNSTQDCPVSADFQYIMFPVVYSVVFVLGTAANSAALWYFLRAKEDFSPSDVFMVNLACDRPVFALTLPFRVVYHALDNDWIFGEWGCKITGSLFFPTMYGSTLFLTCICVDRYIAGGVPSALTAAAPAPLPALISTLIWLLLAGCLLYLTLKGPLTSKFPDGRTACLENFSSRSWSGRISGISFAAAILGFFLPLLVITVCYPLIARRLLEPGAAPLGACRKRRALRTVLLVLAVFLICFVPYHVIQLLHTLRRIQLWSSCHLIRFTYSARRVTMALTSINSCLDPLIYSLGRHSFSLRALCPRRGQRLGTSLQSRGKGTEAGLELGPGVTNNPGWPPDRARQCTG
ncbi:LOW QUALITY PROTEIN: lysophosphatidic acid receptor 6-like [Pristis pectinata]|uniref:LOW QUALITY PROTEIN: lysophosphatidic acid receptor 6-like n=1 Tax=Pristis pectinata TaxID=685728 RepID=UPI00223DCCA2|nr:LOW QUALITY PROTEIN: lysophosphatidic acid receptor 6-like [Pristis pectinata]